MKSNEYQQHSLVRPGPPSPQGTWVDETLDPGPKEQYNLVFHRAGDVAWIIPAAAERVLEFRKSLVPEPPIKLGTPDP